MRVLLFANNWVGWQVTECLREAGDEIVAVVVHPSERQRFAREIVDAAGVDAGGVIDARALGDPKTCERLAALTPDLGVSAMFGYVLSPAVLRVAARGAINLHPAYLPYNRGAHPNVWSIIDRTPAGVTLHWMDAGVDTGAIVARDEVRVEPVDTGETLYRALERAAVALFARHWPAVRAGCAPSVPQPAGAGTTHRARDLARVDAIDLDRRYTGRELLDLLRARTFPPYDGAYFVDGGRKVFVNVQLRYAPPDARPDLETPSGRPVTAPPVPAP